MKSLAFAVASLLVAGKAIAIYPPCDMLTITPCSGDCELNGLALIDGLCWKTSEFTVVENEFTDCVMEYVVVEGERNYSDAKSACSQLGFTLASYDNDAQPKKIAEYLGSEEGYPNDKYWIGLQQMGDFIGTVMSDWKIFDDGSTRKFGNVEGDRPWATGQPDFADPLKKCIGQKEYATDQFWKNYDCNALLKPLCSTSAKCRIIDQCTCGQLGQGACAFMECADGLEYSAMTSSCQSCGLFGEAPCTSGGCFEDLIEHDGSCTYCGIRNSPACDPKKTHTPDGCIDGNGLNTTTGLCVECGGKDQPVCKAQPRHSVRRSECKKGCCKCDSGGGFEKCYEWNRKQDELTVGNNCSGLFQFRASLSASIDDKTVFNAIGFDAASDVACSSTGTGEASFEICEVDSVSTVVSYCKDERLVPTNDICALNCNVW